MKFAHFTLSKDTTNCESGKVECAKLIKGFRCYASSAFFLWFFNGFSTPSFVAHLAIVKEQSRENTWYGVAQLEQKSNRSLTGRRKFDSCRRSFLFPNTSIQQFLTVPAMSILTTGDLEGRKANKRIVTSRSYDQIVNTAHEDVRGEETRKRIDKTCESHLSVN